MSDTVRFDMNALNAVVDRSIAGITITAEKKILPLKKPFAITGYVHHEIPVLHVYVEKDGALGRGEGAGIYYFDETPESMAAEIDAVSDDLTKACSLAAIQEALPRGGARNALDCAFWDFLAKSSDQRVTDTLGLTTRTLTTVFTISIDEPDVMANWAKEASDKPHLKIKLDADRPMEKLEAIRAARPDAKLVVDANQGWTIDMLRQFAPQCAALDIAMIEQPLKRGADHDLEGFRSPVPLGADESCLDCSELSGVAPYYDIINIKLDKAGGLTESLRLADAAQHLGKRLMVGNMLSSSLCMAPSFLIGLACAFVDLDGPLLLAEDVPNGLSFSAGGQVEGPTPTLWG